MISCDLVQQRVEACLACLLLHTMRFGSAKACALLVLVNYFHFQWCCGTLLTWPRLHTMWGWPALLHCQNMWHTLPQKQSHLTTANLVRKAMHCIIEDQHRQKLDSKSRRSCMELQAMHSCSKEMSQLPAHPTRRQVLKAGLRWQQSWSMQPPWPIWLPCCAMLSTRP